MKALVHLALDLTTPLGDSSCSETGRQGLLLCLLEQLCEGFIVQLLLQWTQLGRLSYAPADRSLHGTLLDPMTEHSLCSPAHQVGGITGVNYPKLGAAQNLRFGSLCLLSNSF